MSARLVRLYSLAGFSVGNLELAFRWNGITDGVETIGAVRTQEECRIGGQVFEGCQNAPEMIRLVIAADGKDRAIAPDDAMRTFESLDFGSFDIHLDKRGVFVGESIIQADARNLGARRGCDAAPADAVSGEMDNTLVGAYRSVVKYGTGANAVYESLKAGRDGRVSLESDHLAKAIIGLGNEGLDRVSGVGAAIDEALGGGQREQAGKVLVAREWGANTVEIRAQP